MGKHAMKLQEINLKKSTDRMNKVMESRFGFSIDYSTLNVDRAQRLSAAIGESLARIKNSTSFHTAEKNPRYMELLVVHESLTDWLNSQILVEGELGKSEVILAAKDMVDSIQEMVEKAGKMQNEELPALLDAIKDELDPTQAETFKSQMSAVLEGLVGQLAQARSTADAAARSLAGETVDQPMSLPAGEPAEMPADQETDFDQDEFVATDAAVGGTEELGRERR